MILETRVAPMRKDFGDDTERQFRLWAQNRAHAACAEIARIKEELQK